MSVGVLRTAISVLYIEDNPSNVRLVEKIFALASDIGLSVAREGARGLALAREQSPDLILLDLHLPDMSGEQVLSALLADPLTEEHSRRDRLGRRVARPGKAPARRRRRRISDQALRHRPASGRGPVWRDAAGWGRTAARPATGCSTPRRSAHCTCSPPTPPSDRPRSVRCSRPSGTTPTGCWSAYTRRSPRGTLRPRRARRTASPGAPAPSAQAASVPPARNSSITPSEGHLAEAQALDRRLDELLDQTWEALAAEFAAEFRAASLSADSPSAS